MGLKTMADLANFYETTCDSDLNKLDMKLKVSEPSWCACAQMSVPYGKEGFNMKEAVNVVTSTGTRTLDSPLPMLCYICS